LIAFLLLVIYLLTGFKSKTDRKKLTEPSFCVADEDCGLYNCTNCGNQLWINKNKQSNDGCSGQISISCRCDNNICKRVYK
jgi:peptide methionine sulfoxide reductase MsrB